EALKGIQERYHEIRKSEELIKTLKEGKEKAAEVANQTLIRVKKKVGFVMF
ncbi:MAG TPA: tryptophan--tRNA ligase, partial [Clostridiales bacterium]|nr:tryptophan--tRNA ligase [Clostridiales bacterium]